MEVKVQPARIPFSEGVLRQFDRSATDQQDERVKVVLTYYLLEKAIVGAGVSVLDHEKIDHDMMSLSRAYLKVAGEYAERL